MPTYAFACDNCETYHEFFAPMSNIPTPDCEACHRPLRRYFTPPIVGLPDKPVSRTDENGNKRTQLIHSETGKVNGWTTERTDGQDAQVFLDGPSFIPPNTAGTLQPTVTQES